MPVNQYRFRINQATKNWRYALVDYLGSSSMKIALNDWERAIKSGDITIHLHGGIGDHLQQLSMIEGIQDSFESISLVIQRNAYNTLRQIIPDYCNVQLDLCQESSMHPFLASFFLNDVFTARDFVVIQKESSEILKSGFIFCWQAYGNSDLYSAWNRSISFEEVYRFYVGLVDLGVKPSWMVDITSWPDHQLQRLRQLGIAFYDPKQGTVADLVKLAKQAKRVITIDTALAHICAVSRVDCDLLLCRFHDERWHALLSDRSQSCYARHCSPIQQDTYGDWSSVLDRLTKKLSDQIK